MRTKGEKRESDMQKDARLRENDNALAASFDKVDSDKDKKRFILDWPAWVKIVILVVLMIILAIGIAVTSVEEYVKNVIGTMTEPIAEDYDLSLTPVDGYINILLLGVDSRDMENIRGTRSDMIMIASINAETSEVTLTSLYRDTYLKIAETSTYDKITHACAYGGPEYTIKSLNQAMDLDIENYALVNFKIVADLVDAVGGITVNVEQKEIYQLNKYTKATAKNIGYTDYKLCKKAGEQTLCGVQAVSYGRIRKGVGDDFKRTERMRTVIKCVLQKMKAMSFSEIKEVISIVAPQIKTNMEMSDVMAMAVKLNQYEITSGAGFPYNCYAGMIGEISYVIPSNLAASVTEFHKTVFGQEDYKPSSSVNSISNAIAQRVAAARVEMEENAEDIDDEFNDEYDDEYYEENNTQGREGSSTDNPQQNGGEYDDEYYDDENYDDEYDQMPSDDVSDDVQESGDTQQGT